MPQHCLELSHPQDFVIQESDQRYKMRLSLFLMRLLQMFTEEYSRTGSFFNLTFVILHSPHPAREWIGSLCPAWNTPCFLLTVSLIMHLISAGTASITKHCWPWQLLPRGGAGAMRLALISFLELWFYNSKGKKQEALWVPLCRRQELGITKMMFSAWS